MKQTRIAMTLATVIVTMTIFQGTNADPIDDLVETTNQAWAQAQDCGPSDVTIVSLGPVADLVNPIRVTVQVGQITVDSREQGIPTNITYSGTIPGPTQLRLALGTGRLVTSERLEAPEAISSHNDLGPVHTWVVESLNTGVHRVQYNVTTQCLDGTGIEQVSLDFLQWDSHQRCAGTDLVNTLQTQESSDGPAPSDHSPTHVSTDRVHRVAVGLHTAPALEVGTEFYGGRIVHRDDVLNFYAVEIPPANLSAFASLASADILVRYCNSDVGVQLHTHMNPNDPLLGAQYGITKIKAKEAWHQLGNRGTTGKNICILDTGVWNTHEDLTGARYLGGVDFAMGTPVPWDGHGHGTHVAGIAAATTHNSMGIAGVTQAGYKMVKVFDDFGGGSWSWVASGIRWCADNAGDVISMSLGDTSRGTTAPPIAVQDAVTYAWGRGKLLVAAAGNDGCPGCITYPAKYANVMAITCTDSADALCGFTNQGPQASVAAPGNVIRSTCRGSNMNYCDMSGTSMSTPQVAGEAAFIWNAVPTLTNAQLRHYIECGATDLGPAGFDNGYGNGRIDVESSLLKAQAGTCSPVVCSGSILINGAADNGGTYTQADVSVTHSPATAHPTAWRFTASDGVYLHVSNNGHDSKHVAAGDYNTRMIHVEVDLPCGITLIEDFRMRN